MLFIFKKAGAQATLRVRGEVSESKIDSKTFVTVMWLWHIFNRNAIPIQEGNFRLELLMKAVVYRGPKSIKVEEVDNPKIESPNDVIIKMTLLSR